MTPPPYRVLVTGSRSWLERDAEIIHQTLAWYQAYTEDTGLELLVIHGGADGADSIAATWCWDHIMKQEIHLPDYSGHGRKAPLIRNKEMVAKGADIVVVFRSRGKSRGTDQCMTAALDAGLTVKLIQSPWRDLRETKKGQT